MAERYKGRAVGTGGDAAAATLVPDRTASRTAAPIPGLVAPAVARMPAPVDAAAGLAANTVDTDVEDVS